MKNIPYSIIALVKLGNALVSYVEHAKMCCIIKT